MQVKISLIAKKYAIAFLNVFSDQISNDHLEKWLELEDFLKKNKLFYVYLSIPRISYPLKQKALSTVAKALHLQKPITKIMFLLLEHGRIEILHSVLNKIIYWYRQFNNIEFFKITSSHKLSEDEKKSVVKFAKFVSKKGKVVTDFDIDKKLICGLRIQSNIFLWERSIAKQLRDVKQSIFKQVDS